MPHNFWWASSLSSVAAALIIVAIINSQTPISIQGPEDFRAIPKVSLVSVAGTPKIDWKAESAILISLLAQELLDLQSDLIKAKQKVKQNIGL